MQRRFTSLRLLAVGLVAMLALSACIDLAFKTVDWTKEGVRRLGPMAFWYEKAEAGDPEAQYFYGKTFCCGKRPAYDNHEAMKWFCKAARLRQRDALYEIGRLYAHASEYEGFLLPQDDVLASVYYHFAADNGHALAKEELSELARRQTAEQRSETERLTKAFPNIPCGVNYKVFRKEEAAPVRGKKNGKN